jgi:TRAP-type C4-dicarboxylate transport system permease small subunit
MAGTTSAQVAQTGGNTFLRCVGAISTFAGSCSAAMILLAVFITCQMIFVRFVLNESTVWQTEMVIYSVVAATLIGLSYVQRLREHVNVDLIPIMLSPRTRYFLCIFTLSISIFITCIMLVYGFEY